MQKFPRVLLAACLVLLLQSTALAQAPPWLYTNGVPVFSSPPMVIDKSFYAPIRFVAASLGFSVGWNQSKLAATLNWEGNILEVYANSKLMIINGEPVDLVRQTVLTGGTLYVPLRSFAEVLGVGVNYSQHTNNVYLYSSWSGKQQAQFASPTLSAQVFTHQNSILVTIKNTSNVTQHAIPIVREWSGKLDFASWVDIRDGRPLTFLRPGEEYITVLNLPAWAYNTEYVEIMWVDSTKFRGLDPEVFSLLTMYLSLIGN